VSIATLITVIVALAMLNEAINEYLFVPIIEAIFGNIMVNAEDDAIDGLLDTQEIVTRTWTALTGILVMFMMQIDIFAVLGVAPLTPWFAYFVGGVIVGRGSNFAHDILTRITGESIEVIVDDFEGE
jgi:hypothetical protein